MSWGRDEGKAWTNIQTAAQGITHSWISLCDVAIESPNLVREEFSKDSKKTLHEMLEIGYDVEGICNKYSTELRMQMSNETMKVMVATDTIIGIIEAELLSRSYPSE